MVEDCDSFTGYTVIHFGPKNPWGLFGGDGLVIIEDGSKPSFLPDEIKSTKEQDKKLLSFARILQGNPPKYWVNWFNCRHFVSIMRDVGIKDNPIQWQDFIPLLGNPFGD